MTLINPILECFGEKRKWKEACLSLPQTSGGVVRSESCKVTYMNLSGETKSFEASWPFSGGLQHECDHLDGKLYITHMERANKNVTLEKLKKNRKKKNRGIY
jgi:peptide deformylase